MSNITRETLIKFFTDHYQDADGNTYTDTNSISLGNIGADGDLGKTPVGTAGSTLVDLLNLDDEGIGLLGDYLSYITQNFHRAGPNEFFIEKSNKTAATTDRGTSVPSPTDDQHGANNTFTENNGLSDTLADYSNSKQFDSAPGSKSISDLINKIGDPGAEAPTGHDLYNDIPAAGYTEDTSVGDTADPVKSSFAMLKANNRFNVKQPTKFGYDYVKDGSTKAFALGQTKEGTYYNSAETESGAHKFKFEQLKKVGHEMLKTASQFSNGDAEDIYAEDASPRKADSSPFTSVEASSGAFEEVQADKKIKSSFTSPDNKFITVDTYTTEDVNNEYFRDIIADFRTKVANGGDGKMFRENNSVYTTNSYHDSVDFALDVLFPKDDDHQLDPFYSNVANVISKIIVAEEDIEHGGASYARKERENVSIATKFLDNMAVVGDVMLTLEIKSNENNISVLAGGYYDVDKLSEGPATRIAKSKTSKNGPNSKSLAWRGSSLPSLYHLPSSVVRSMQNMGAVNSQNPMKGMLAGGLTDKTYMSIDVMAELKSLADGDGDIIEGVKGPNKIPKMLVQRMEDQLDAEYVPFYFHDLRTNEIISFHAFLDDLTDSFTANWESNDGFGRMDPVRIFKNTTRDIGFSFKVVATSEQDFDEMWFKINKLITLLYPQWSEGEQLKSGDTQFTRPFSQVPVGSPMIRLRIGDVIKSNYSRFNLARIFGSGHPNTYIEPGAVGGTSLLAAVGALTEPLGKNINHVVQKGQILGTQVMLKLMLAVIGSPLQYVELIPDDSMLGIILKDIAFDLISDELRNGFMSPAVNVAFDRLRHPDGPGKNALSLGVGAQIGDAVMLKPSNGKPYISVGTVSGVKDIVPLFNAHGMDNDTTHIDARNKGGMTNSMYEKILTTRHLKCRVIGKKENTDTGKTDYSVAVVTQKSEALEWTIELLTPGGKNKTKFNKENVSLAGRIFTVSYDDFVMDPDYLFGAYFSILLDPVTGLLDSVQQLIDMFAGGLGISTDNINLFTTSFEDLMHPVNNSITKAFETSSGRGLAGVISSMSFNWIDGDSTPWETSFGSRAPKICNIKVKFDPVHDIAPGLDSDGFNRAPTHNVGSIMNNLAGDPYEKGFDSAKKSFDKAMNASNMSKKG